MEWSRTGPDGVWNGKEWDGIEGSVEVRSCDGMDRDGLIWDGMGQGNAVLLTGE